VDDFKRQMAALAHRRDVTPEMIALVQSETGAGRVLAKVTLTLAFGDIGLAIDRAQEALNRRDQ
jgi:hypothetical protein